MPRALLLLTLLATTAAITRAQWTLHDAHTTADLRGIDNVGHGVAWASGTDGTILRTEDAGIVWQLCAKPPNGEHLDFRAIQAFDNSTAIIMSSGKGDLSRLYKTTDGCQSWHLLFTNPDKDGFWDALQFEQPTNRVAHPLASPKGGVSRVKTREPDHLVGRILGDPVNRRFVLFATFDGGLHWTRDDGKGIAVPAHAGVFAASNSSLLILANGPEIPVGPPLPPPPPGSHRTNRYDMATLRLVCFVTGGEGGAQFFVRQPDQMYDIKLNPEWRSFPLPLGNGTDSSGAFSIALIEHHRGVVVGGDYLKPTIRTRTAAFISPTTKHWHPATTPPHGFRSAVAYDTTTSTWITVGPNGTDISTDDGRNWHALHPDPKFNDTPDADQHWNALSLPYAVGPHGRIATLRPSALPSK